MSTMTLEPVTIDWDAQIKPIAQIELIAGGDPRHRQFTGRLVRLAATDAENQWPKTT
jgi:hypothetical protein